MLKNVYTQLSTFAKGKCSRSENILKGKCLLRKNIHVCGVMVGIFQPTLLYQVSPFENLALTTSSTSQFSLQNFSQFSM